MILNSNKDKYFSQKAEVDLIVSLSATYPNLERMWQGFHSSLSQSALEVGWDEFWKY